MATDTRDSILFIFTDQHRADALGAAGDGVIRTPHLDRLAREGVLFRQTYCQSPVCMPSRSSVFSGRYPHQHGILGNGATIWPDSPCFVRAVRDRGWHTAVIGKLHFTWRHDVEMLCAQPLLWRLGFSDPHETTGKMSAGNLRVSEYSEHLRARGLLDGYYRDLLRRVAAGPALGEHGPSLLGEDDQLDGWIGNRAVQWLASHDGRPFLLWVGPPGPHNPFDPPEPYASLYRADDMPDGISQLADDPHAAPRARHLGDGPSDRAAVRAIRTQYYGNVSLIDARIGAMLGTLEARGALEHTWVIYASDHGEFLGDRGLWGKSEFYAESVRVPLIVRPPDRLREAVRGQTSDALVELIDVSRTILDIAGADPDGHQGRSLLPLLLGQSPLDRHRGAVFSEIDQRLMVCTGREKLVVARQSLEPLSYWDLTLDPRELTNRAPDPGARPAIDRLIAERIRPFLERTPADMGEPWAIVAPYGRWGRNPLRERVWQVPPAPARRGARP